MEVSFTGSRRGANRPQHDAFVGLLEKLRVTKLVHGDCIGWDAHAHYCALAFGCDVDIMPAESTSRAFVEGGTVVAEPKHPLARNKDIIDATMVTIGCPGMMNQEVRSGTWHALRYARRQGKQIYVVWPDGTVTEDWD